MHSIEIVIIISTIIISSGHSKRHVRMCIRMEKNATITKHFTHSLCTCRGQCYRRCEESDAKRHINMNQIGVQRE